MSDSEVNLKADHDETAVLENSTGEPPAGQAVKSSSFAETSTAAKLSGSYHIAAGKIKSKFAEYTDNPALGKEGHDQELLGKIHRLVGSLRGVRETTLLQVREKTKETQKICMKHGGRLLDVATDFIEDLKKTLLK